MSEKNRIFQSHQLSWSSHKPNQCDPKRTR